MAYPVILFDRDLGSDSLASGAGPVPALSGGSGINHADSISKWAIYDSGAPSLSGIALDGTAVLRAFTASGRQFSRITSVKNTVQTTYGDATASSATITNVGSIAGMSVNDPIRISGTEIGGTDLYTTIESFGGSGPYTIALKNAVGSTNYDTTITCPKYVQVIESLMAQTAIRSWAIGGYLLEPEGSARAFTEILAGWSILLRAPASRMPYQSGISNQILIPNSGDGTAGRITIQAEPGAVLLSAAGENKAIEITGSLIRLLDLEFSTASYGIHIDESAGDIIVLGARGQSGTGTLINFGSNSTGSRFLFSGLETVSGNGVSHWSAAAPHHIRIENSIFDGGIDGGSGIGVDFDSVAVELQILNTVFWRNSRGINIASGHGVQIEQCIFASGIHGVFGNGTTSSDYHGLIIRNNSFSDMSGTCLSFSGMNIDPYILDVDYNNFWNVGVSRAGVTAGAHDTANDPRLMAVYSHDFRSGVNMRGAGGPSKVGSNPGFDIEVDMGLPRNSPGGGSIIALVDYCRDAEDAWEVGFTFLGGGSSGTGTVILVPKSSIPASGVPVLEAIFNAALGYFRDHAGTEGTLAGREVQV